MGAPGFQELPSKISVVFSSAPSASTPPVTIMRSPTTAAAAAARGCIRGGNSVQRLLTTLHTWSVATVGLVPSVRQPPSTTGVSCHVTDIGMLHPNGQVLAALPAVDGGVVALVACADTVVRPQAAENPDGAVGLGGCHRGAGDASVGDRLPYSLRFDGRLTRRGGFATGLVPRRRDDEDTADHQDQGCHNGAGDDQDPLAVLLRRLGRRGKGRRGEVRRRCGAWRRSRRLAEVSLAEVWRVATARSTR